MAAFLPRQIVIELVNVVERTAGYTCGRTNQRSTRNYNVRKVGGSGVGYCIIGRLMVIGEAGLVQNQR